jgi:hypothetical protein
MPSLMGCKVIYNKIAVRNREKESEKISVSVNLIVPQFSATIHHLRINRPHRKDALQKSHFQRV